MATTSEEELLWLNVLTRANAKIAAAHYQHMRGEGKHPAQACEGAFKRRKEAETRLAAISRERLQEKQRKLKGIK